MYYVLCKRNENDSWDMYSQISVPEHEAVRIKKDLSRNRYIVKIVPDSTQFVEENLKHLWRN